MRCLLVAVLVTVVGLAQVQAGTPGLLVTSYQNLTSEEIQDVWVSGGYSYWQTGNGVYRGTASPVDATLPTKLIDYESDGSGGSNYSTTSIGSTNTNGWSFVSRFWQAGNYGFLCRYGNVGYCGRGCPNERGVLMVNASNGYVRNGNVAYMMYSSGIPTSCYWQSDYPSNSTYGSIWLGTSDSISRYQWDGTNFVQNTYTFPVDTNCYYYICSVYYSSSGVTTFGGYVIFGLTSGKVIRFNYNDPGTSGALSTGVVQQIIAGDIITLANYQIGGTRYLLAGTSLGLLVQYNWDQKVIANLVVVSLGTTLQSFTALTIDTTPAYGPVAFYATSSFDSTNMAVEIGRINLADPTTFVVFDSYDISNITSIKYLAAYGSSNFLVAGTSQDTSNNNTRILRLRIADCSTYNCSTCSTDPYYCGYCASSDTCVLSSSCSPASAWSAPANCPSVSSLSVTSGSSAGGTNVTFIGTNFYSSASPSDFSCNFAQSVGPTTPYSITSTSVSCTVPAKSTQTVGATVNAWLSYKSRQLTATMSYEYYYCDDQTCDTCPTRSECSWCYRSSTCKTTRLCSGPTGAVCPQITAISPTALSVSSTPANVSLTSSFILPSESYYCNLGGVIASGTVSGNTVTCSVSSMTAATSAPQLMVNSSSNLFTVKPTTQSFEFYNCYAITACKTCGTGHPLCQYCTSAATKCTYNNETCTAGVTPVNSCAYISSLNPTSLHVSQTGLTLAFNLSGLALDAGTTKCLFTMPNGTTFSTSTSGTYPSFTCPAPSALAVGTWKLAVTVDDSVETGLMDLPVYTCPTADRCSACIKSSTPLCNWCPSSLTCDISANLGGCSGTISSSASCPILSYKSEVQDTLSGQSTLTLNVSLTPPAGLMCSFGGITASATITGNTATCTVPATNVTQIVPAGLVDGTGKYFAEPFNFTYYDCVYLPLANPGDTPQPRTCLDCYTLPGCTWCSSSCDASADCQTPDPTCPDITSVVPVDVEATVQTLITITANIPLPDGLSCLFSNQSVPATIVNTQAICLTPVTAAAQSTVTLVFTATGQPWASRSLPINFFSCPTSTRCVEDICFNAPNCGWCLDTGKCQGQIACTQNDLSNIWQNTTCPAISDLNPDFIQVAPVNFTGTIPTETISATLSGVTFPPMDGKRSYALSDFECLFQDTPVQATSFDPTTNVLTCVAPTLTRVRAIDFTVTYKGFVLNGNDQEFDIIDCLGVNVCALCSISPNCGWCRGSTACMTPNYCNAETYTLWSKTTCPRVRQFQPSVTSTSGGETITVTGEDFLNAPDLYFLIVNDTTGAGPINVTYVSDTQLTFVAPPYNSEGEVDLLLTLGTSPYVSETTALNYRADSSAVNVPVTASLSSVAGLIAIGAIVAVVVMKQRKVGFFSDFKLVEPDYNVVAYGSFLQQQYRWPKDKYNGLEMKLINNRYFVTAIVDTTSSTEQDAVARALVFFFEQHSKTTDLLIFHIDREVHLCIAENTIFRTNSMASKFFKFYSKIVGIKFIFFTLARFILELERLSERNASGGTDKEADKDRSTSSKSLLSMEMEVDPSKQGDAAFADSEANLYQLILTCQKIFSNIRENMPRMPREFIQVFKALEYSITTKFGNEDAVYKAVGGFLFLRFIGPAITAPHAYGLLEKPPNPVCQRQLVLIGKVTQGLANLVLPGAKETFMLQLTDFIQRNIPKMKSYYREVLTLDPGSRPVTEVVDKNDIVRLNSLAVLVSQILTYEKKLREHFPKVSQDSDDILKELNGAMEEIVYSYKQPKKYNAKGDKEGGDD